LWRDEGCRDKNGYLLLVCEIGHFVRHKTEHIISFLWEFNKDGLAKGTFSRSREGIGQLFGGGIDIFYNRDSFEKAVSPTDQFMAQDIGGDHSDQVEQEEETDDSQPRKEKLSIEKIDRHVGHEGAEDIIHGVEGEVQYQKGDPEGQDDQDSCEDLCPKMSKNILCHSLVAGNWRIFFRSASSTTSFSSKRRASSPSSFFLAVRISFALR